MTFLSLWNWLKPLRRRVVPADRNHRSGTRPSHFVPRLHALEDRTVPSTLTVTNNLDTGAAGDGSLRGEIAAAQSGDTINFTPSLAGQTITLTQGELAINKSLDIEGLGADQLTISGGFEIASDVTATIAGLTLCDGYGGAIGNSGTLTINNSTLTDNVAANEGGAIYNDGDLTVNNSTLSGNLARGSTAGSSFSTGRGATAGSGLGGGIYMVGGTLSINASTIADNEALGGNAYNYTYPGSAYGGGLFIAGGTVMINNSIISGNEAIGGFNYEWLEPAGYSDGGGICNLAGPGALQMYNTIVANNIAAYGNTDSFGDSDLDGSFTSLGQNQIGNSTGSTNQASQLAFAGSPSSITAGISGSFTVTAQNADGSTDTGYTGTVHFSSSDGQAGLPADYTFTAADAGVHTFSATLRTAGTQSLTATDTTSGSVTGSATGITVNPAAASTLSISGYPSSTTAGVAGSFTVTLKDPYGNIATGYTGTVHFTSSDAKAVLPANYTFTAADAGQHTFSATLKTAGTQSLTATDTTTASLSGSDGGITVQPAAASKFILTAPSSVKAGVAFSLTLTVEDAYGNIVSGYTGTVHFSSTDTKATLPKNYTFTAADQGKHTFSGLVLRKKGYQKITLTDTQNSALTGSMTIDVL
jgi:hypothetical protein